MSAFCKDKASEDFVPSFGAEVKSDRCCDEKACQCVCHFYCQTFKSRMEEFKRQEFTDCTVGEDKKEVIKEATKKCKVGTLFFDLS